MLTAPSADRSWGPRFATLAGRLGLELDPWQRLILDVGCRVDPAGRWAASEVGLMVPRQNGKTSALVARMLGGLVLLGENQLLAAHRMHVTLETWKQVVDLLDADPVVRRLVIRVERTNGQEAVHLRPRPHPHRRGLVRPRLEVVAGTPRARGPRGKDLLVVDELREVPAAAWTALTPTVSSPTLGVGRAQTWTASNAGTDDTEVLNGQRDRGRAGTDPRLAWLEWSTLLPWDDTAGWWQANPALGIRKDPAALADAARRALGDAGFRTEHLCQWVTAMGEGLDLRAWTAAADPTLPTPPPGCVLAVDVTPARTDAAIAAAWRDLTGPAERVCCRLVWTGPPWQLPESVDTARRRLRAAHVVYDPATAEGAAAGRRPAWQPLTVRHTSGGCQQLVDLLASGRLGWAPDDDLVTAAAGAVRRPRGDGWGWGRRMSTANIAPLVALTLAVVGLDLAPARARIRGPRDDTDDAEHPDPAAA